MGGAKGAWENIIFHLYYFVNGGTRYKATCQCQPRVMRHVPAQVRESTYWEMLPRELRSFKLVFVVGSVLVLVVLSLLSDESASSSYSGPVIPMHVATNATNPRVFMHIEIDGTPAGRMVFELFANVAPITAENFRALCTGELNPNAAGISRCYANTFFHRIISGYICQGGILSKHGPVSAYGGSFETEFSPHGAVLHEARGMLSMASTASQFFITMGSAPELDGKYVV